MRKVKKKEASELSDQITCSVSGTLEFLLIMAKGHQGSAKLTSGLNSGRYHLELQGAGVAVIENSTGKTVAVSNCLIEYLEFSNFEIDDHEDIDPQN